MKDHKQRLKSRSHRKCIIIKLMLFLILAYAGRLYAMPDGGVVVSGSGTITRPAANNMQINQSTPNLILNWQDFSIATNEQVRFVQPSASAVALNRVLGSDPSYIYGQLTANGRVFLVNPSGVLFGPGSKVDVGGFVASTLNISDSDFLSGKYSFSNSGRAGSIINQGQITAAEGGYIALLAPEVRNEGIIAARMGTVAIGAGDKITLDMVGDGLINIVIDQAALNASIANKNLIQADGGQVIMSARSADALLNTVVNNEGIIEARTISNKNGVIRMEGGESGIVSVSGTLDASGQADGETGGSIKILGERVGLYGNARINASGDAGGGTILVGGNYQGKGLEQNAKATYIGHDVTLNADALRYGNGGKVVVWADDVTRFYGNIFARGGMIHGDGGFVEVSGKGFLEYRGLADLRAPNGNVGTILLDPTDITITGAGTDSVPVTGSFSGGDPDLFTGSAATSTLYIGTGSGDNNPTLLKQLSLANVTISTNSGAGGDGDITIADNIAYTGVSSRTLILEADRNIIFTANKSITANNASLNVTLNSDHDGVNGGVIVMNSGSSIYSNGGNIILGGGADPLLNPAVGYDATYQEGIKLDNAILNSGGGSISLRGTGRSSASDNFGISLVNGARIESGGGAITLIGTGGTGTDSNHGVCLNGAGTLITSQSGNISITGTGMGTGLGESNRGIYLVNDASIQSSSGKITLIGIGGNGTTSNQGVFLNGADTLITSQSGDISITGTGMGTGASNYGFYLFGGADIISTGTSRINISGTGAGTSPIGIYTTAFAGKIGGAAATGDITLTSDKIHILNNIQTTGAVNIQNKTAGIAINLGSGVDTAANTLEISDTEIDNITAGAIYIGRNDADASGAVTVSASISPAGTGALNVVTGNGDITLNVGTSITMSASSGNSIVLATTANFINNAGAGALNPGSGTARYLIYSTNPGANTIGGLTGGNLYNRTYAGNPPASITRTGNQFIYSIQPTLTFTADNKTKTYGDANAFTSIISGYIGGDNAASAYTGAEAYALSSEDAGARVITPGMGTLTSPIGYNFSFANGVMTINKASLTINPLAASRVYGNANNTANYDLSTTGLKLSDTKAVVSGVSYATNALADSPVAANAYSITMSGATASNYDITYGAANGTNLLSVTRAPLTVTADNKSRLYGMPNPTLTESYSGFKLGQDSSVLGGTLSIVTPATQFSFAGNYAITPSGLTSNNYNICFIDGVLQIKASPSLTYLGEVTIPGAPENGYSGAIANAVNSPATDTASSMLNSLSSPGLSPGIIAENPLYNIINNGINLPEGLSAE